MLHLELNSDSENDADDENENDAAVAEDLATGVKPETAESQKTRVRMLFLSSLQNTQGRTQRVELLRSCQERVPVLVGGLLAKKADELVGQPCHCGEGVRAVRCLDCTQMPPLCVSCYVGVHKWLPFHWAERWDETSGYFWKTDVARLSKEGALLLGHYGDLCPNAKKDGQLLTVVDDNGPHGSMVRYCGCPWAGDKWEQLFEANLFPGSFTDPGTAYPFRVLRTYEVHATASKKNARDYAKALAQLANREFPDDTPVSSSLFMSVREMVY